MYFYPVGTGGWPKDPPNYIAFRYYGKLQSIHHVEDYEIITKMYEHLFVDKEEWEPMFLLKLGRPFRPAEEVKTGNIYKNGRIWLDLDTLFTSETIREAYDISKKREEESWNRGAQRKKEKL